MSQSITANSVVLDISAWQLITGLGVTMASLRWTRRVLHTIVASPPTLATDLVLIVLVVSLLAGVSLVAAGLTGLA